MSGEERRALLCAHSDRGAEGGGGIALWTVRACVYHVYRRPGRVLAISAGPE